MDNTEETFLKREALKRIRRDYTPSSRLKRGEDIVRTFE